MNFTLFCSYDEADELQYLAAQKGVSVGELIISFLRERLLEEDSNL